MFVEQICGAKGKKMRLINPTRAEERIVALYRKEKSYAADIFNTAVDAAQTIILDMYDNEAIEAEPVRHAKWIKASGDNLRWNCSKCGYTVGAFSEYSCRNFHKWCGGCGAKMDEVEE